MIFFPRFSSPKKKANAPGLVWFSIRVSEIELVSLTGGPKVWIIFHDPWAFAKLNAWMLVCQNEQTSLITTGVICANLGKGSIDVPNIHIICNYNCYIYPRIPKAVRKTGVPLKTVFQKAHFHFQGIVFESLFPSSSPGFYKDETSQYLCKMEPVQHEKHEHPSISLISNLGRV